MPPRISARVIAALLALAIAFIGMRIFSLLDGEELESPTLDGENGEQVSKEETGDNFETESKKQFDTSNAANAGTVINAKNAVLCCFEDGNIIAQKEPTGAVPLKDATVFMVALTVSKAVSDGRISLADEAVCPASAAKSPGYSLSSQVLPIGKRMRIEDILKCMLYQSGTSYAYTLAVHISGSVEAFTKEMSEYATTLGVLEADFKSCVGDDDGTTLNMYDFAVIMKSFFNDKYLSEVLCSDSAVTVDYSQNSSIRLVVKNDFFESFCTEGVSKSDGVIGGKVCKEGYLKWACVLFQRNGKTYLSVAFESEKPFSDALMLYSAYVLCA